METASQQVADEVRCECGKITGERCAWVGHEDETAMVEWTPPSIRRSIQDARAAGNLGGLGAPLARRDDVSLLRLERSCAETAVADEPEWTRIVEST